MRVSMGRLSVAADLAAFIRDEALPGTGVDEGAFWAGADRLISEMSPRISENLRRRVNLQAAIDEYHASRCGAPVDHEDYESLLRAIGYLTDLPDAFAITTSGVDFEVVDQPGPQLVVPLLDARFAINAANARWGSLYAALYGSDVIPDEPGLALGVGYNVLRGRAVMARGRAFLDEHFPLEMGSHTQATAYTVDAAGLLVSRAGGSSRLAAPAQFVGATGDHRSPATLLMVHHGLHVEILVDREHPAGSRDPAGVRDIVIESAVTAVMDLEDSVSAVDSADKVLGYRNWLGLMQRTLTAEVTKEGRTFTRFMNAERTYRTPDGSFVRLPSTSLLFVRHVGNHMTTDAVLGPSGEPVSEGLLDALVTGLCSVHDLRGPGAGRNSRAGAMYVVKPKLHGPDEVAVACEVFAAVETILNIPDRTIKIGIMDEERRTSANLMACIFAARDRVAFINTGFLDRTGDEIRTSTYAGPMVRKAQMKHEAWMRAYEDQNVDVALACGFMGRAQIGKGMWASPDNLADMLREKVAHPQAGATCAWVPSPTAATLHALHYHQVDVRRRQQDLALQPSRTALEELLTIPLADAQTISAEDRRDEIDDNVQSTLGYVVRWIDAGVGCSKVPDITGTPRMEDRATCRISSQLVSNWLLHGVITAEEVEDSLRRMAVVVDHQNQDDPTYQPMAPDFDGHAFRTARELLISGTVQPAGYTEPLLHHGRKSRKLELKGGRA